MIESRIAQINEEYSQLSQLEDWDLTLEAVGEDGNVRATLRRNETTFEKTFGITDDLQAISETFNYSDTMTPRSKDIALNGLKSAYFDEFGNLITERKDTKERFRIKDSQKEEMKVILKEKLGKLFHG